MRTSSADALDTEPTTRDGAGSESTAGLQVTNHLTEDRVAMRAIIGDILNTQRLEVLRAVRKQPVTVSELDDSHSITRPTANKYLSWFADLGLVEQQSDKAYAITGGGTISLRILGENLDRVDRDALSMAARSPAKIRLLRAFAETIDRAATLEAFDTEFSRSTRATHRRSFEERGWIMREGGSYHLTSTGETVLTTYEELEQAFKQIVDKAPCLRTLGPECEELPVAALADAEQIITKSGAASLEATRKYERLIRSEFELCRGLCSYYEPGYARAFASAIDDGKQAEIIGIPKLLRELPFGRPEEWGPITAQLLSDNYHGYLYRGSLPLGLAVFDKRVAVFGASDPTEIELNEYEITSTIFTENEAVIEWAINLFKSYEQRSISEVKINSATEVVDEIRTYLRKSN